GSGAFLVAACRYLADRVVEAWTEEDRADAHRARTALASAADAEVPPVLLDARRLVAEQCLYGADINPLAVEMAKLSLWLVTMDRERPFGFLDDRFVRGDSLLGLASMEQLETLHVDPTAGRGLHADALNVTAGFRALLRQAADVRRRNAVTPVTTIRDVQHKQALLIKAQQLTNQLNAVADAVTGKGLATASLRGKQVDAAFVELAIRVGNRINGHEERLHREAQIDVQAGRPPHLDRRQLLHWPLRFPEVFGDAPDPGFDAIIGNPPFLDGRKISGRSGRDYLGWLQRWDGNRRKGSADLAARFVLRAARLLSSSGQLGFITTNTLVQGDTLAVGMTQLVEGGMTIRRGRSSHPWPSSSASIEILNVWASKPPVADAGERWLDGEQVPAIGPDLELIGRVAGRPLALPENKDLGFQGHNVLGPTGFTMAAADAIELIARDSRNAEALQPFMIGKDLNQRPDCSASRWIINFREWTLDQAATYPDLLAIVEREVRPERAKKDAVRYPRMVREWWKFWQYRQGLEHAIAKLGHVLALSRVGNSLLPVRLATGPAFSEATVVFALDDFASFAVLSSNVHSTWVIRYTSTMRTDIRYAPSDVFVTLPRPDPTPELHELGKQLDVERRKLMLGRGWGLTTTYNYVHSPTNHDPAVQNLRELHAAIDHAVLDAYGWDLDPEVGHHRTKIGTRWTVSPRARFELLDLLLAENHRRHAASEQ
ncbi:MAG: Eco57I restriction-modification methylase domain-containing protein, partial [Pseudonocardiaceae bacterium]